MEHFFIVMTWLLAGLLGLLLVVLGLSMVWKENKDSGAWIALIGAVLVLIFLPAFMFDLGTDDGRVEGQILFQGKAVTFLEIGEEYNVLAVTNVTDISVYLILESVISEEILLYERARTKGIPEDLSIGDVVVLTTQNELAILQ